MQAMLLALLLAQPVDDVERISRSVAQISARRAIDASGLLSDGPAHLRGFKAGGDGIIVLFEPLEGQKAVMAHAVKCDAKGGEFYDGTFLRSGETAAEFAVRNRTFRIEPDEISDYSLCAPSGSEFSRTLDVTQTEEGTTITSSDRLILHLMTWSRFFREHPEVGNQWQPFALLAVKERLADIGTHLGKRNVTDLARRIDAYYDKQTFQSELEALLAAGTERQTVTEYYTTVLRARRKLFIFDPEKQRAALAHDEAALLRLKEGAQ